MHNKEIGSDKKEEVHLMNWLFVVIVQWADKKECGGKASIVKRHF